MRISIFVYFFLDRFVFRFVRCFLDRNEFGRVFWSFRAGSWEFCDIWCFFWFLIRILKEFDGFSLGFL